MSARPIKPGPDPADWNDFTIRDTITVGADPRPTVRVAVFGLAQKLHRLLEIVIRHARHNPYRYVIAHSRGPGEFDLALVDMTAKGGAEVARTLRRISRSRPVVTVGRRSDPTRPRDDLLQAQFTVDVLRTMNVAVERRPGVSETGSVPAVGAAPVAAEPSGMLSSAARKAAERAALVAVAPAPVDAPPSPDGTGRPRVLVVDDSPTVRSQLSVALRQMGLDSDAADCAELGLQQVGRVRYDLIFVDVNMAGMDGFKLTRLLRRGGRAPQVPVVILTSRSSPFDLARGALAGCSSYLVKPVSMRSLRDTVARHLRHRMTASVQPGAAYKAA